MGSLKDFISGRANGTIDEYIFDQYRVHSTRTVNFVGFGRHVINTQDVDIVQDMQNHVRYHKATPSMTALSYHIVL